jgi:peroxin-6
VSQDTRPLTARPPNPIVVPPDLFRSLFPHPNSQNEVMLQPTPFSARTPTIPTAHSVSVCRLATSEGIDKRYERAWLKGLKSYFAVKPSPTGSQVKDSSSRLMRRGDVFGVPVWLDSPSLVKEQEDEEEDEGEEAQVDKPTAVVYFRLSAISYEPLVALEDDFRSSVSSKARAGELGCWVDVGVDGTTQMVLEGLERDRVTARHSEKAWHSIRECFVLARS